MTTSPKPKREEKPDACISGMADTSTGPKQTSRQQLTGSWLVSGEPPRSGAEAIFTRIFAGYRTGHVPGTSWHRLPAATAASPPLSRRPLLSPAKEQPARPRAAPCFPSGTRRPSPQSRPALASIAGCGQLLPLAPPPGARPAPPARPRVSASAGRPHDGPHWQDPGLPGPSCPGPRRGSQTCSAAAAAAAAAIFPRPAPPPSAPRPHPARLRLRPG